MYPGPCLIIIAEAKAIRAFFSYSVGHFATFVGASDVALFSILGFTVHTHSTVHRRKGRNRGRTVRVTCWPPLPYILKGVEQPIWVFQDPRSHDWWESQPLGPHPSDIYFLSRGKEINVVRGTTPLSCPCRCSSFWLTVIPRKPTIHMHAWLSLVYFNCESGQSRYQTLHLLHKELSMLRSNKPDPSTPEAPRSMRSLADQTKMCGFSRCLSMI